MACVLLISSAMFFVVPLYIAFALGQYAFAGAIYILLLTSILNHGTDGKHPFWHTVDKYYAHALATTTTAIALWYGLVKRRSQVYTVAGLSGLAAGAFYLKSKKREDGVFHVFVHLSGAIGCGLLAIAAGGVPHAQNGL